VDTIPNLGETGQDAVILLLNQNGQRKKEQGKSPASNYEEDLRSHMQKFSEIHLLMMGIVDRATKRCSF
jgi:hypothetical protein